MRLRSQEKPEKHTVRIEHGMVECTYNLSHSGGRGRRTAEAQGLKASMGNTLGETRLWDSSVSIVHITQARGSEFDFWNPRKAGVNVVMHACTPDAEKAETGRSLGLTG